MQPLREQRAGRPADHPHLGAPLFRYRQWLESDAAAPRRSTSAPDALTRHSNPLPLLSPIAMTGKGFLEYAKAEAHQQAKVSSGTTSFMQTGADRIAGLQCIAFHSGPGASRAAAMRIPNLELTPLREPVIIGPAGQHAVLVDVLPILIHEHGMIEKEKPTWLHEGQLSRVQAALDRREDEAFRELAHEIRSVLGPSTLIAFVLDGGERPRAKLAKMSERERRRCEKAKRQKPLACGSKASDVLNIQAPRKPWMQSVSKLQSVTLGTRPALTSRG